MPTHVTHGQIVSLLHVPSGVPAFAQLPIVGVTADSTFWTADTTCVTADGRIVCVAADVAESASALEAFDAITIAGGAVIPADVGEAATASDLVDAVSVVATGVVEAADASDTVDAVSSVSADAIEPASALDVLDAATDVAADVVEAADALDELDAVAVPAGVFLADVAEVADALDVLDADVISVEVPVGAVGGAHYPRRRPLPVYGVGHGILPPLWGEAHGVVGVAGQSTAQVLVRAAAVGACGQAGNAAAVLKALSVAGHGAIGTRGSGAGTIMKFSASATGRHDDDEAAVIAFLLAA
jgi:hypothetical protein